VCIPGIQRMHRIQCAPTWASLAIVGGQGTRLPKAFSHNILQWRTGRLGGTWATWAHRLRLGKTGENFGDARTSYMASFVNTRTVSREGFFLRLRRYHRNVLTFASGLRRYFLESGCGRRPHQPAMEGRSRPALRRGRLAAGRCAQRPRNSRVPSVGPSKRWAPARASGPSE